MASSSKPLVRAACFGLVLSTGYVATAVGQQPSTPAAGYGPSFRQFYQANQARTPPPSGASIQAPASGPTFSAPPAPAAYVPYNPYATYNGPVGGALSGAADVIGSQGQLMTSQQQAFLMREQVRQAKIDTRRKNFDENQYEQAMTPTPEQEREFSRVNNVLRSLNNPPVTEIWSGKALNDLLIELQLKFYNVKGPPIPVAPGVLQQINFTSGATGTARGLGLLKFGGKLEWPPALQEDAFQKQREDVNQLAYQVVKSGQEGAVDAQALRKLNQAVTALQRALRGQVENMDPNDYIQALRFLNELAGNVSTLRNDPNAQNLFASTAQLTATNVAGLVREMTARGLKFAPAVLGEEAAYQSLHSSLADYTRDVHQVALRSGG